MTDTTYQSQSGFFVNPIRSTSSNTGFMFYDPTTKELTYNSTTTAGTVLPNGTNYSNYLYWDSTNLEWTVGNDKVHIGTETGQISQGNNTVAIGYKSGNEKQGASAIAIGTSAGTYSQGANAIAIGDNTGYTNQGSYAIAIGVEAGYTNQGSYAIAIGNFAAQTNQIEKSIVINASDTWNGNHDYRSNEGFFVNPVRNGDVTTNTVYYNITSKELTYKSSPPILPTGSNYGDYLYWNSSSWTVGSTQIKLGKNAGNNDQGEYAVAIGFQAGYQFQGDNAIAIGQNAGHTNQGDNAIAIGQNAGHTNQGDNAIAIGYEAGKTNQGINAVAIGIQAGQTNQGSNAVAVGNLAGTTHQGTYAVAIGTNAGYSTQGEAAVAIGYFAGKITQGRAAIAIGEQAGMHSQKDNAIAIGTNAGYSTQGAASIAIGEQAGYTNQGANAIAIGKNAGQTNQKENSIILNANPDSWPTVSETVYQNNSGFFVNPVRDNTSLETGFVFYDTTTKELTYNSGYTGGGGGGGEITQIENIGENFYTLVYDTTTNQSYYSTKNYAQRTNSSTPPSEIPPGPTSALTTVNSTNITWKDIATMAAAAGVVGYFGVNLADDYLNGLVVLGVWDGLIYIRTMTSNGLRLVGFLSTPGTDPVVVAIQRTLFQRMFASITPPTFSQMQRNTALFVTAFRSHLTIQQGLRLTGAVVSGAVATSGAILLPGVGLAISGPLGIALNAAAQAAVDVAFNEGVSLLTEGLSAAETGINSVLGEGGGGPVASVDTCASAGCAALGQSSIATVGHAALTTAFGMRHRVFVGAFSALSIGDPRHNVFTFSVIGSFLTMGVVFSAKKNKNRGYIAGRINYATDTTLSGISSGIGYVIETYEDFASS